MYKAKYYVNTGVRAPDPPIRSEQLTGLGRANPIQIVHQYNETNVMYFLLNLLRTKASTGFEHYLLILRRRYTSGIWCIAGFGAAY
jgi:hypothetical protein